MGILKALFGNMFNRSDDEPKSIKHSSVDEISCDFEYFYGDDDYDAHRYGECSLDCDYCEDDRDCDNYDDDYDNGYDDDRDDRW